MHCSFQHTLSIHVPVMLFPKLSIVNLIYLASVALCTGIQFLWPLCGAGYWSWCRDPAANGYSAGRKIIHNHWITAAVIHEYRLAHDGNQKGALWLCMFCKATVLRGEGCIFLYLAVSQSVVEQDTPFTRSALYCRGCVRLDALCYLLPLHCLFQWHFMALLQPRLNGNWVLPKSSPPVVRTGVQCCMERSAFITTGEIAVHIYP